MYTFSVESLVNPSVNVPNPIEVTAGLYRIVAVTLAVRGSRKGRPGKSEYTRSVSKWFPLDSVETVSFAVNRIMVVVESPRLTTKPADYVVMLYFGFFNRKRMLSTFNGMSW